MKNFITDIRALLLCLALIQNLEKDEDEEVINLHDQLQEMGYLLDDPIRYNKVTKVPYNVEFNHLPYVFMDRKDWIEGFYKIIEYNPDYFRVIG